MIFGTKTLSALALFVGSTMAIELYGDPVNNDPAGPLYLCQGDCDSSAICACDMICHQIESPNTGAPGCTGVAHLHPFGYYDYCVCPPGGCDPNACAPGESILPPGTDMEGDPHVKAWNGEWFDYMGECDLKMVHASSIDTEHNALDIHARTKIRHGYSFIESAAIRIGEDVLEVSSWGEYAINGVVNALDGKSSPSLRASDGIPRLGGYRVYHTEVSNIKNKFDIYLAPGSNITISNMKDLVSVRISGAYYSMFSEVTGLWGNFHGELLGRDGVQIEDVNALGQEWQVRDDEPMLFRNARAPQYPAKCVLPNIEEKEARRLAEGITEEAAKVACDHLKSDEHAFHNCIYDVTATNDLDVADAGSM